MIWNFTEVCGTIID